MPLTPEAAAILSQGSPVAVDFDTLDRFELAHAMRKTVFPKVPVPNPVAIESILIPGPPGGTRARIYRPAKASPLPVVVNFHGGGWVMGDPEMEDFRCHHLAHSAGCAIISIDYRLAPEHPFPTPFEDCYAATAWIARNAKTLDLDSTRLAVMGSSAGGNLAAAVCLAARDRGGPAIGCQLLYYPAVDIDFTRPSYRENGTDYGLTARAMSWFYDQYLPAARQRKEPYALPMLSRDLSHLPPALVVTAEYDVLRDEGAAYAAALRAAGNEVAYICYPGLPHGFMTLLPQARESYETIEHGAAALRRGFAVSR